MKIIAGGVMTRHSDLNRELKIKNKNKNLSRGKVGHGCRKTVLQVCGYVQVNYSRGQSNFYCFKTSFFSFFFIVSHCDTTKFGSCSLAPPVL